MADVHHADRPSLRCDEPGAMLIYSMSVSVDGFIADREGAFGVDGPERRARRPPPGWIWVGPDAPSGVRRHAISCLRGLACILEAGTSGGSTRERRLAYESAKENPGWDELRNVPAPVEWLPGDEGRAPDDALALCLSGGGYRAMLFHLGVLFRLNEAGYLPRLDRVSSVSGGSIPQACSAGAGPG